MSTPFSYRGGVLCAEAVPLDAIARAVGTPAYVYCGGHMRHQMRRFQDAFAGNRGKVLGSIDEFDVTVHR